MARHSPVRLGVIGIGNRGTALLRSRARAAGHADRRRLRRRAQAPAARAGDRRERRAASGPMRMTTPGECSIAPTSTRSWSPFPATLHEPVYRDAIAAGKHLYAEKPLALTLAGCDRLIAAAAELPSLTVHVGFQRRSNPRFREGVELIGRGELGPLIEARATWTSSNGPMTGHGGWLGRRERSGDWMVEQAVHVWDVLHWITGESPVRASGWGRRGLFAATDPLRDVTDHYAVELEWADGFRASFVQSWIAPADEGFTGSSLRVLGEEGGFDFVERAPHLPRPSSSPPDDPARPSGRFPDGARGVPRLGPLEIQRSRPRSPWPTPAPPRESVCSPARPSTERRGRAG